MGVERISFSGDAVVNSWDFLSKVRTGEQTGIDFRYMFQALGKVARRFSLQLRQMCAQMALMALPAIVILNCAIHTLTDFPWQNLCDLITQRTGKDESTNTAKLIKYIQSSGHRAGLKIPDTPEEQVEQLGNWTCVLHTQKQDTFF